MTIKFLDRNQIDREQYQSCLSGSSNSSIYADFEYLDSVSFKQWGALILDDYEAVFPLPWRFKWGLYYIYMPLFCQQLGIFGNAHNLETQDFLNAIPRKFIRVHLNVNAHFGKPRFASLKPNYVLSAPLNPEKSFNKDAWKNIQKCLEAGVEYQTENDIEFLLKTYHDTWGPVNGFTWNEHYIGFHTACEALKIQGKLFTLSARLNDVLLGTAIFLVSENSIHYVCAAPTEMGKKYGIMHGIIYEACKKFPQKNLDFEGSSIPSVAQFYKKFGPDNHPYYSIRRTLWWNL